MPSFIQDLRHAVRQLRNAPGFALTVILTLAVGIGSTTAIFTLVYDVLLRPLPYAHPEQLVVMEEKVAEFRDLFPTMPLNANHFDMWQRNSRTIEAMTAISEKAMPLGIGEHPSQVETVSATPGIFPVFSAQPQLGRVFTNDDAQPGRDRVLVLMNDLWRNQFGADPAIVGKTVTLNGLPYTVLGVMPPAFHLPVVQVIASNAHPQPIQAIVPMVFSKEQLSEVMGDFNYFGVARLRPGVSLTAASAEINSFQHTIQSSLAADELATISAQLTPYQQTLIGANRTPLLILLAAVAGLLLVGCVNIANLLLSRAVGRRQQMAVAAALGARRGSLLRMAMRETMLLAALGGALGIALAAALVPLLQHYLPAELDFRGTLHLDWAGAACALLLSAATALLAGAIPAWMSAHTQPAEVLHTESRLAGQSRSSKRLRSTLVAFEVAISVALVLSTGLLISSLAHLLQTDRGFDAEHTITAKIALPTSSYNSVQSHFSFYKKAVDRLAALPGVEHAGLVSLVPLDGDRWLDMIRLSGDRRPVMQLPTEHFRYISPDYPETVHLPLVAGRYLSPGDEGKNFALVSELTAHAIWPGRSAVGQQFTRGGDDTPAFTVIGVVRDARTVSLAAPDPMMVYVPYWYRCDSTANVLIRTRQDPSAMAGSMRNAIWSVDAAASVPEVRSLDGIVASSVANRRFEMDLLLVFAVSALLLAGLGVYGVVTYSVVQRQREIGLRLALGAQRSSIYSLILREGLTPVAIGALAGVAIAVACARVFAAMLFEVSPYNPLVMSAALAVLASVGVAACLLPARRAAAVEPMQALRTE